MRALRQRAESAIEGMEEQERDKQKINRKHISIEHIYIRIEAGWGDRSWETGVKMMNGKGLTLIHAVSKRDQVVASFKEAILSGEIEPGEAIVESRIAKQLGAGIPLVREALIELEQQGYVRKVAYKGTTVTRLSREDVEQIFRLRVELETLAIDWARERVTEADLSALRELTIGMRQAAEALDLARFYEKDLAFHRLIWQMSGNDYLADCLERVVVPLFAFFVMKNTRQEVSYIESARSHERIVDGMAKLSGVKLRELMKSALADWRAETLDELLPGE